MISHTLDFKKEENENERKENEPKERNFISNMFHNMDPYKKKEEKKDGESIIELKE